MDDGQIRVGVVGLGAFGRHHAKHYAAQRGARLVAVADVDIARARQAATDFAGEALTSHRDLIGRVDAVSVAVPASGHAAVAGELIEAGIHVLVEKPIATDSASARHIVQRAERSGVILQVGHLERYSPVVREMRKRLTRPLRITAIRNAPWSDRCTDVDVILDMMIHDIDHALALADAPIASVSASGATIRGRATDEAEAWLTFANGVVATLSASRVADRRVRKLTVSEAGMALVADLANETLAISGRQGQPVAEVITCPSADNLGAEIAAFLDAVRTRSAPEADGRSGLVALEVAEQIQAAIAEPAELVRARV